jgi:hypothetical protein
MLVLEAFFKGDYIHTTHFCIDITAEHDFTTEDLPDTEITLCDSLRLYQHSALLTGGR